MVSPTSSNSWLFVVVVVVAFEQCVVCSHSWASWGHFRVYFELSVSGGVLVPTRVSRKAARVARTSDV